MPSTQPELGPPLVRALLAGLAFAAVTGGRMDAQQDGADASAELSAALGGYARERLADPGLHARAGEPVPGGRFARLLEDLGLRVDVFESGIDDDLALGFAFDLAKSRAPDLPGAPAVDLVARGNVAFDPEDQPHDYTTALLRLRWSGARALSGIESPSFMKRRDGPRLHSNPTPRSRAVDAAPLAWLASSSVVGTVGDDVGRARGDARAASHAVPTLSRLEAGECVASSPTTTQHAWMRRT